MIDILVASTNYMALDAKQARKCRPYPPLATLYAAGRLRQAGFSVAVFDATLAADEREFFERLTATRPRIVALYEDTFNFLSKMCLARMREASLRMVDAARAAGCRVVAAGADVTDNPATYLGGGVDYALAGEPDHALFDLTCALLGRIPTRPDQIPGVIVADDAAPDGLRRAAAVQPERQLDVFPPPAWDLIDLAAYRGRWMQAHGHFSLNLVTTRGCPFHCNWCAKPIWGQRYAMHSPGRVAADLAHLQAFARPDHVWFADDIFGLRPSWVLEFAREVEARGAHVPFTIQTRADLMTPEAVAALARAGCTEAWLGAESGSQRILDAMEKGTTVGAIAEARRRLGHHGIRTNFFLQFGYPGESWVEILETVEMVRTLLPDQIGVSVTYPLPGTGLYARVREELGAKTHWTDSDDLAMMFQGTFTTAFYRRLHELLHRELDLRLAIAAGASDRAADLAALLAEWEFLAAAEAEHRTAAPVRPALRPVPDRPLLTLEAN
jgi:anaerobic magnesium-protoporphyrin IX monomethyl ester cyclase